MSTKMMAAKLARTCNWCETETSLLLDVWCDKRVQHELRRCPRNQPVFDRIAAYLQKNGYHRTGNQCREKVKTLKKEFNYAQNAVKTGAKKKSDFRFWDRLESVLTSRHYNTRYFDSHSSEVAVTSATITRSKTADAIKQEVINLVSDVDIVEDCGNSTSCDGNDQPGFDGEEFPQVNFGTYDVPTIEGSYQITDGDYAMKASLPFDQARLEKVIEEAADKVVNVLTETRAQLLEFEEKRMKFEAEQEEKRRKENRDHEIKLLNSVGQMFLQAIQVLHQNSGNGGAGGPPDGFVATVPISTDEPNTSSSWQ